MMIKKNFKKVVNSKIGKSVIATAVVTGSNIAFAAPVTKADVDAAAADTYSNIAIVGIVSLGIGYAVSAWINARSLAK